MTLREEMTNEIKSYGWADFYFKRGDYKASRFTDYVAWLNSLSDHEFLSVWRCVTTDVDRMD